MELVSLPPEPIEVEAERTPSIKDKQPASRYTTTIKIGYIAGMGSGNPEQITDDGLVWYDC